MENEALCAAVAAVSAVCIITEEEDDLSNENMKRKHRVWMRSWMVNRYDQAQKNTLFKFQQELISLGDVNEFRATLRMPPDVYEFLLESVRPFITKKDTNYRKCIPAEERLSMTMHYLALGDYYRTLRQTYRVGMVTVGRIIHETSAAINKALHEEFLKVCSFFNLMGNPDNPLQIPEATLIPGLNGYLPFYTIGDDAFALSAQMMKPIPPMAALLDVQSRIYNYRISRGHMVVKDAFGILSTRFRIFRREIKMHPEGAETVVMAAVVLHNMVRNKCGSIYMSMRSVDQEDAQHIRTPSLWRGEEPLDDLEPARVRNSRQFALNMRLRLRDYFLTKEGEVPWQYVHYMDSN